MQWPLNHPTTKFYPKCTSCLLLGKITVHAADSQLPTVTVQAYHSQMPFSGLLLFRDANGSWGGLSELRGAQTWARPYSSWC